MTEQIAKAIIAMVQQETGLKLTYIGLSASRNIHCLDTQLRRNVIICYGGNINPIVRGIVREQTRGAGFNWHPNGKANENAEQVTYWTEEHRYKPTAADIAAYFSATFGERWPQMVREGICFVPENIPVETLLKFA